jgi:S-adenosylmethionine/arginine decarboxylase-like enzyme
MIPEPAYGQELLLDLHGCDVSRFNRTEIRIFLEALCDELDMEAHDLHFWDDLDCEPGEEQTDPKTKGTTAVQFLLFSNITIHTLDLLGQVYINVFSCKPFNTTRAFGYCADFFDAKSWRQHLIHRG